jgi:hypothetical protein
MLPGENRMTSKPRVLRKRNGKPKEEVLPQPPLPPFLFDRLNLKSYRGIRGLIARVVKCLLNGQLDPKLTDAALPWIDKAFLANDRILQKENIDEIRNFLEMPPADGEEIEEPEEEAE